MPSSTDQLEFYDLSHPWGDKVPLWPYFPDVKIERFHYHAKSQVLSQQITTFMHCTTHTDAPAHVIEGTPFMDEVPLDRYFGTAVVVSIPKGKWEKITPEDLYNQLGPESALVAYQHNPPTWRPPENINTPSLWLAGEKDAIVSVDGLRRSAQYYRGDFEIIPQAGHNLMLEHNNHDTAKLIHNWLVSQQIE